jgi:hypothetical protein
LRDASNLVANEREEDSTVLYAFCFERIGVVVGDLYFSDPTAPPSQQGAERGVRLEVRVLDRPPLPGSVYSAQPITVDAPIWRLDLLETVNGPFGSFDRTHHHPTFTGWEPGDRVFDSELSGDPLPWLGSQLSDLDALVARSPVAESDLDVDAVQLRAAIPEILDTVERLLRRVHDGELGRPPTESTTADVVRNGWL